jgi:hypothetical protein
MRSVAGGVTRGDVEAAFPGWEILSVEPADTMGLGWPLNKTAPHWYRLRLPASPTGLERNVLAALVQRIARIQQMIEVPARPQQLEAELERVVSTPQGVCSAPVVDGAQVREDGEDPAVAVAAFGEI